MEEKKMTTEENEKFSPKVFEAKMRTLEQLFGDDPETFHYKADCLMCKVLSDLGYEAGVKVFDKAEKWNS